MSAVYSGSSCVVRILKKQFEIAPDICHSSTPHGCEHQLLYFVLANLVTLINISGSKWTIAASTVQENHSVLCALEGAQM